MKTTVMIVATAVFEALIDKVSGHEWPVGLVGLLCRVGWLACGGLITWCFMEQRKAAK